MSPLDCFEILCVGGVLITPDSSAIDAVAKQAQKLVSFDTMRIEMKRKK